MEAMSGRLFVPDLPTLYPSMLLPRWRVLAHAPFDAASVHWFYFARNAIWLAVKRLGIEGGEVLVPAYHHGVEVEALVDAGARPVFYRVGTRWDGDLQDVARRIGPETRALYLTHYGGFPGPVREMKELAGNHGLPLIEDCALSLLSKDGDRALGTVGDLGIFCLYKTLPVPNGGAMVVNGPWTFPVPKLPPPPSTSVVSHLASALLKNAAMRGGPPGRWLRSCVRRVGRGFVRAGQIERVPTGSMHFDRAHVHMGISPVTLRIARSQDLAKIVERRRRNYLFLLDRLRDVSPPLFDELPPGVCPLFYPIVANDKPELLQRLWARGVEATDFWRDHHPACDPAEFPDVMWLRSSIVEVPCHQDLDLRRMTRMAEAVREAVRG